MNFVKTKRSNTGFTLTELVVTFVVIAVVAGLAMPYYGRAIESARAHQAVAGLRQIYTAERIYRLEEGFYFPDTGSAGAADINDNLTVRLNETDWTYALTASSANSFTATATRAGGSVGYSGGQIQIDESGTLGALAWPLALPQE